MLFLGIDGGGTKTDFLVLDENGKTVASKRVGTISYKTIGIQNSIRMLKDNITDIVADIPKRDQRIYICAAYPNWGESTESDSEVKRGISQILDSPIKIVNDCMAGWAGSLAMQEGINLVAGTGSIAYGRNNAGQEARAGGWSEHFSDEGSCYWLGLKSLELFSKESDGRIAEDVLLDIFREYFQLERDMDMIDIFDCKYKGNRTATAGLQRLLLDAALSGDNAAKALYEQAAGELSAIVIAVWRHLGSVKNMKVSYSGGLFHAGEYVLSPLGNILKREGIKLCPPRFTPVQGAALLAASYYDKDPDFLQHFMCGLDES